jgi:hypothetical protein
MSKYLTKAQQNLYPLTVHSAFAARLFSASLG